MYKRRFLSSLFSIVVVFSCSTPAGTGDPIVGSWNLKSWAGKSLPARTYGVASGFHELLVAERLVLEADGSYRFSRTTRYMPNDSVATMTGTGSWKRVATGYEINYAKVKAKLSGSTLIVQWSGDGVTDWEYGRE